MAKNDLELYSIGFDAEGYIHELHTCIDRALDWLSDVMSMEIKKVIAQCSEASSIMIDETLKHVREISRKITDGVVELEVGIDEGAISGSEQTYVRVMVTLHGNLAGGLLYTKPGQSTWKKHVTGPSMSNARAVYALPQLQQFDNSGRMMENFEKEIQKYVNDFYDMLYAMVALIDYSQFLTGGG